MAKKRTAWNRFSQYTRVRDCINTTGRPFLGICITCNKQYHIRFLQAGHCFPQRRNSGLFDEQAVNAQCRFCNIVEHGQQKKYRKIMEDRFGEEAVEQMHIKAKKVTQDKDMDFDGLSNKYREKTKELLKPFGYSNWETMMDSQSF